MALCFVVGTGLTFGSTVLGDGIRPGKVPIWASIAEFSCGADEGGVLPGGGRPFWPDGSFNDTPPMAGFSGAVVEAEVLPGGGAPFWPDGSFNDTPP